MILIKLYILIIINKIIILATILNQKLALILVIFVLLISITKKILNYIFYI